MPALTKLSPRGRRVASWPFAGVSVEVLAFAELDAAPELASLAVAAEVWSFCTGAAGAALADSAMTGD